MTTQLIFRLPIEEKNWLELEAERLDVTLSDVIRNALRLYVAKSKSVKKNSLSDLVRIADELTKKHHITRGPKNLSTTYKQHLYGTDFK